MDNLIYDRNQLDIINLTSKAYYNYSDLNRIEEWCEYLANILNNYNYFVNISTKTNWTMLDLPKQSEVERIRNNINTLKQAYFSFTQIPENLEYMTIEKANAIEKILHEIDYILRCMENNFVYCGVAGCGQNRIWQQRFRKPKTWNAQPYKLSQFSTTDTLKTIATDSGINLESSTEILRLAMIDKKDDVLASVQAINDSMQALDDLVGYECKFHTLTNLLKPIEEEQFYVGVKSNLHTKYGDNSLMINGLEGDNEEYASSKTTYKLDPTHIYYACVEVYSETGVGSIDFFFPNASPSLFGGKGLNANTWTKWSIVSSRSSFSAGEYPYRLDYNNGGVVDKAWFDGLMIIDLTEAFGAGNEPNLDWCNANIPYFSGTQTIKIRKESA